MNVINGIETNLLEVEVENIREYVAIGFCQPKFYKPAAWNRAKKCMNKLTELGYVKEFDYGWGKGKYTTTEKGDELMEGRIYAELVKIDFQLVIRKTKLKG